MKAFVCIVLLAATTAALAAPEGKRDKRGYLSSGLLGSEYSYGSLGGYSLGHEPLLTHSIISSPTILHEPAYIHEPAIVSVNKIVEVPKVISVKKFVSVPQVVSVPHVSSHLSDLSYSPYAPSFSAGAGWW